MRGETKDQEVAITEAKRDPGVKEDGSGAECEGGVQVVDGTKVEVASLMWGCLSPGGRVKLMVAEKLWGLDSVDLVPNKRFSVLWLFSLRKLSENQS